MRGSWSAGAWRAGLVGLLAVGLWGALAAPAPRAYTQDQVTAGGQVYAASCANCHGARGEGSADSPLLVGPRALTGFRDAQELYQFNKDSMPQDLPNSLPDQQYWDVTAWLIAQNGLSLPEGGLGPGNAAGVSLRR